MSEQQFMVYRVGGGARGSFDDERIALEEVGARHVVIERTHGDDDLLEQAGDADGLIIVESPVSRQAMAKMDRLKVVLRTGVGIDVVDIEAATDLGIAVVNIPDLWIREVANPSLFLRTVHARVDPSLLFGTSYPRTLRELRDYSARIEAGVGAGHLEREGIETLVLPSPPTVDRQAIRGFIRALPSEVFRVKGIVRVADTGAPELLSVVCGRGRLFSGLRPEAVAAADTGEVVVIGKGIGAMRESLAAGLEACRESL